MNLELNPAIGDVSGTGSTQRSSWLTELGNGQPLDVGTALLGKRTANNHVNQVGTDLGRYRQAQRSLEGVIATIAP